MSKISRALQKFQSERYKIRQNISEDSLDSINIFDKEDHSDEPLLKRCLEQERELKELEIKLENAYKALEDNKVKDKKKIENEKELLLIELDMLKDKLIKQDLLVKRINHITALCLEYERKFQRANMIE